MTDSISSKNMVCLACGAEFSSYEALTIHEYEWHKEGGKGVKLIAERDHFLKAIREVAVGLVTDDHRSDGSTYVICAGRLTKIARDAIREQPHETGESR